MVPERNWEINWSINLEDKADIKWRLENEARSWEAIIQGFMVTELNWILDVSC